VGSDELDDILESGPEPHSTHWKVETIKRSSRGGEKFLPGRRTCNHLDVRGCLQVLVPLKVVVQQFTKDDPVGRLLGEEDADERRRDHQ
jgi:hypothetical protein